MSPAVNPFNCDSRILIVDNYDSYTFNLHSFCAVLGCSPVVVRNNQFSFEYFIENVAPLFHAIIISPGPGNPQNPNDVGISSKIMTETTIPVLGVCLGHQSLALENGAKVIKAAPMHGRLSQVTHNGKGIFKNIPSPFKAVRYHSLIVSKDNLPKQLQVTATCDNDNIIMALKHTIRPIWSVQFHPESICTEYGLKIMKNFLTLSRIHWNSVAFS
jgi:para-aminobenzoate synthetase